MGILLSFIAAILMFAITQLGWKVLIPVSCVWVVVVCAFKLIGFGPWFA